MTDDKIIEQIRQLLRIASDRGVSINERELAQRRAERLMVRYRIETLPEGDEHARAPGPDRVGRCGQPPAVVAVVDAGAGRWPRRCDLRFRGRVPGRDVPDGRRA